jgi:Tol biopolymer transport system component
MIKLVNNKEGAEKIRHLTSRVNNQTDSESSSDTNFTSSKSENSHSQEVVLALIKNDVTEMTENPVEIRLRKDGRPRRNKK